MFPLCRNQSMINTANQMTGFLMMGTLVINKLIGLGTFSSAIAKVQISSFFVPLLPIL